MCLGCVCLGCVCLGCVPPQLSAWSGPNAEAFELERMKRSCCLFAAELTGCEGEVGGGIGRDPHPLLTRTLLPLGGVSERVKLN